MQRTSLPLAGCVFAILALVSCGPAPKTCAPNALSTKAQLCADRDTIELSQSEGTVLGTRVNGSLTIRNGGQEDLAIGAVSTSGDGPFRYLASWDDSPGGSIPATTVKGGKEVYFQIEFTPTVAKAYSGTISITSNAVNAPTRTISVTGCGVLDAGIACP